MSLYIVDIHGELEGDYEIIKKYEEPTTKNDLGITSELAKNSKELEKDFGELDCISRAQTQTEIEMNASRYTIAKERGGMGQVEWSDQLIKVSDAVDIIRNLPSITLQEPRWITVSEKLPDIHNYSDNYLVTLKRGGVYIAMFTECDGKHWWTYDDVVAWMPLPREFVEVEK